MHVTATHFGPSWPKWSTSQASSRPIQSNTTGAAGWASRQLISTWPSSTAEGAARTRSLARRETTRALRQVTVEPRVAGAGGVYLVRNQDGAQRARALKGVSPSLESPRLVRRVKSPDL